MLMSLMDDNSGCANHLLVLPVIWCAVNVYKKSLWIVMVVVCAKQWSLYNAQCMIMCMRVRQQGSPLLPFLHG